MIIYNVKNKKNETIDIKNLNELTMYVCGPTVYDKLHIGNARPIIFFDVVYRYFKEIGLKVNYVVNITDIDDKIINKALSEKVSEKEIAERYIDYFYEALDKLKVNKPTNLPKATDYLEEMISFIKKLIENGFAYEKDGNVYFRVRKIEDYGLLSGQDIDQLEVGARIEADYLKEDPLDFSLWKKTTEGITYDSPFGKGRPGWHTECAVLNDTFFGKTIVIHGGGIDLKFPHHENERAQFIAANGVDLAEYFMYCGHVSLGDQKMSKSLGNIIGLDEIFKRDAVNAFKLLILSNQYQQPIGFKEELFIQNIDQINKMEANLKKAHAEIFLNDIRNKDIDLDVRSVFLDHLSNNFNTPNAITIIYQEIKNLNKEKNIRNKAIIFNTINKLLDILGISFEYQKYNEDDLKLYKEWQEEKTNKNFEKADLLREALIKRELL